MPDGSVFQAPMVVGYKGEIGRFILAGLLEHLPKANDIFCTDVSNSDEDVVERLEKADYVFLCVPLQATRNWLIRYKSFLGGRTLVEQCSLKSFLYEDPSLAGIRFLSMHLLFRPSATPVEDRQGLLFSQHHSPEELAAFSAEMEAALKTPWTILESQEEPAHVRHDRLMARLQALLHRVLLTLAEELDDPRVRTYVGLRVGELAERIRAGDPVLYRMIQENPFLPEELERFKRKLEGFQV